MSMQVQTFGHSCFCVSRDGQSLLVDPGVWSHDVAAAEDLAGIIITHQHPDHCDPALLADIIAKYPSATVLVPQHFDVQLPGDVTPHYLRAQPGETHHIGVFQIETSGGEHAPIDQSVVTPENLAVYIDQSLYYPGDSFVLPSGPVDVLALPVAAPWMRISQALDFLRQVRPARAFPVHDAILSPAGKELVDRLVSVVAEDSGVVYERAMIIPTSIPETSAL